MSAMDAGEGSAVLRIGELSRRVGVSEHLLRAWESRYGLLTPARSVGGYRLYSEADADRIRRMQGHLAAGLAAAQAARAAIDDERPNAVAIARTDVPSHTDLARSLEELRQALDTFDEPAAQACIDRLLTAFTVETVLRDAVLPFLHEVGVRWEQGTVSVAKEHFASHVVRGRLANLARGWGNGVGPRALLACPPGEEHELALMTFGIVLNRNGWRIAYLGGNTPMTDILEATAETRPSLVVMTATTSDGFLAVVPELSKLARLAPLAIAGAGATQELADNIGAQLLAADPVTAAETFRAR